jgi:hypothetical protein
VGAPACNLTIQEAEAGGSQVWGQPGLHNEILLKNQKQEIEKKKRQQKNEIGPYVLTWIELEVMLCEGKKLQNDTQIMMAFV